MPLAVLARMDAKHAQIAPIALPVPQITDFLTMYAQLALTLRFLLAELQFVLLALLHALLAPTLRHVRLVIKVLD